MTGAVAPDGLRASLRSLPRPIWFLVVGTFLNRFGTFVVVFLVLYFRAKGYSTAMAGGAVSAYGLGAIGSSFAGGWLADRLGRRNTIAVSMLSSAATMLGLSQAGGLALLLSLAGVAGFSAELYRPAASALIADLVPSEHRVAAFGAYRFAINLGFAAGPVTAGLIAQHSFFLLFVVDALTSLAYGVLALTALPEGTRVRRHEERRGEFLRTIRLDRRFQLLLPGGVLMAFVYFQYQSTFALQVIADHHSKATYGALLSINGIAIVLFELPLIAKTRRLPRAPTIAVGAILQGIGFGLIPVASAAAWLALTVLVWTLGEMVSAPLAAAYVADLSPERLRGRYSGAWSLSWGVGLVLGPSLGALVYSHSHTGVWLLCLGCGFVSAAFVLASSRPGSVSRRTEAFVRPPGRCRSKP